MAISFMVALGCWANVRAEQSDERSGVLRLDCVPF
jgi:hypothetical protein